MGMSLTQEGKGALALEILSGLDGLKSFFGEIDPMKV